MRVFVDRQVQHSISVSMSLGGHEKPNLSHLSNRRLPETPTSTLPVPFLLHPPISISVPNTPSRDTLHIPIPPARYHNLAHPSPSPHHSKHHPRFHQPQCFALRRRQGLSSCGCSGVGASDDAPKTLQALLMRSKMTSRNRN